MQNGKKPNGRKKSSGKKNPRNDNGSRNIHHGPNCTVCHHERRAEVELMLLRGKRYTDIARMYPPLSGFAIRRHHIGIGMKALTVRECEKLWSDIIRHGWPKRKKGVSLDHVLKASEYLARKAGAFKDKHEHEHTGSITIDDIVRAERDADRERERKAGKE
jgi:hypothetical protein